MGTRYGGRFERAVPARTAALAIMTAAALL